MTQVALHSCKTQARAQWTESRQASRAPRGGSAVARTWDFAGTFLLARAGWGRRQQPWLSPCRHLKTAGNLFLVRFYLKRRGSLEGGEGAAVLPGGDPRTARREHPRTEKCGWGCGTPWLGPTHNDAIARPRPRGAAPSALHSGPGRTPPGAGNQVRAGTRPMAAGLPLRGGRQQSGGGVVRARGVCPAARPGPAGPSPRSPPHRSRSPLAPARSQPSE